MSRGSRATGKGVPIAPGRRLPPRTGIPASVDAIPARAERVKLGSAEWGYAHTPARTSTPVNRNGMRLSEIEKLIAFRLGGDYDVDDETYLRAAIPTLLFEVDKPGRPAHRRSIMAWARRHLPKLVRHQPPEWFAAIEGEFAGYPRPKPRRADAIARDLQVSFEEHETLDMNQIGFVGGTPEVRAMIRKAKNAAHQARKRALSGATPREQSLAAGRPWEREGVSRRTWYRRQAGGGTNSS